MMLLKKFAIVFMCDVKSQIYTRKKKRRNTFHYAGLFFSQASYEHCIAIPNSREVITRALVIRTNATTCFIFAYFVIYLNMLHTVVFKQTYHGLVLLHPL